MGWKFASAVSVLVAVTAAWILNQEWQAIAVPSSVQGDDAWKAKIIHVAAPTIERALLLSEALGVPPWVSRYFLEASSNIARTGWPHSKMSDKLTKVRFDSFDGVRVKIYEDLNTLDRTDRPALVLFHGGGFVWGSQDSADSLARLMTNRLGIVVISVDYRLAPEHPFPAAYDDCLAATNHVLRGHVQLGINVRRVMVGGESAGGNLAAGVAAQLKKRVNLQILIYPMLQAFDFLTPAYVDNAVPFVIGPDMIIRFWLWYGNMSQEYLPVFRANKHLDRTVRTSKYARYVHSDLIPAHLAVTNRSTVNTANENVTVSDAVRHTLLDPRFAPLMADSLDDYPDAYVITAQHDVLRDDGIMYTQRLMGAKNVRVKLEHYNNAFHGFCQMFEEPLALPVAVTALENLIHYLEVEVLADS